MLRCDRLEADPTNLAIYRGPTPSLYPALVPAIIDFLRVTLREAWA